MEMPGLARPLLEEGSLGGQGLTRGSGEMLDGGGLLGLRQVLRPGPKADGPGYPGFHGPDNILSYYDINIIKTYISYLVIYMKVFVIP